MTKRFTCRHLKNGYAAMGNARGRPIYKGITAGRSVAQAIAEERAKAARQAKIKRK